MENAEEKEAVAVRCIKMEEEVVAEAAEDIRVVAAAAVDIRMAVAVVEDIRVAEEEAAGMVEIKVVVVAADTMKIKAEAIVTEKIKEATKEVTMKALIMADLPWVIMAVREVVAAAVVATTETPEILVPVDMKIQMEAAEAVTTAETTVLVEDSTAMVETVHTTKEEEVEILVEMKEEAMVVEVTMETTMPIRVADQISEDMTDQQVGEMATLDTKMVEAVAEATSIQVEAMKMAVETQMPVDHQVAMKTMVEASMAVETTLVLALDHQNMVLNHLEETEAAVIIKPVEEILGETVAATMEAQTILAQTQVDMTDLLEPVHQDTAVNQANRQEEVVADITKTMAEVLAEAEADMAEVSQADHLAAVDMKIKEVGTLEEAVVTAKEILALIKVHLVEEAAVEMEAILETAMAATMAGETALDQALEDTMALQDPAHQAMVLNLANRLEEVAAKIAEAIMAAPVGVVATWEEAMKVRLVGVEAVVLMDQREETTMKQMLVATLEAAEEEETLAPTMAHQEAVHHRLEAVILATVKAEIILVDHQTLAITEEGKEVAEMSALVVVATMAQLVGLLVGKDTLQLHPFPRQWFLQR